MGLSAGLTLRLSLSHTLQVGWGKMAYVCEWVSGGEGSQQSQCRLAQCCIVTHSDRTHHLQHPRV